MLVAVTACHRPSRPRSRRDGVAEETPIAPDCILCGHDGQGLYTDSGPNMNAACMLPVPRQVETDASPGFVASEIHSARTMLYDEFVRLRMGLCCTCADVAWLPLLCLHSFI